MECLAVRNKQRGRLRLRAADLGWGDLSQWVPVYVVSLSSSHPLILLTPRRSVELKSWTLVLCPPDNTTLPPQLDVRMVGAGGEQGTWHVARTGTGFVCPALRRCGNPAKR